jgi:hypothetical protein
MCVRLSQQDAAGKGHKVRWWPHSQDEREERGARGAEAMADCGGGRGAYLNSLRILCCLQIAMQAATASKELQRTGSAVE